MNKHIKALIEETQKHDVIMFDFDSTIVDSLKYWYYVQDKLTFKYLNIKPNKEFYEKRQDKINIKQAAQVFIELTNAKTTVNEVLNFWHTEMLKYYTTKIKPLKGIHKFLLYLKDSGKKLVLASATEINLLKKALTHFNLNIFDEIFTELTIGCCKACPEFFTQCLTKLKINNNNIFFFEDSFSSIASAFSVNIACCAIIHKYNKKRLKDFKNISKFTIRNYKKLG